MNFVLDKNRVIRALRLILALAAGIVTAPFNQYSNVRLLRLQQQSFYSIRKR